jgi:hypothetical protein
MDTPRGTASAATDGGELGMEGDSSAGKELEHLDAFAVRAQAGANGYQEQGRALRAVAFVEQGKPPPSACILELAIAACAQEGWPAKNHN